MALLARTETLRCLSKVAFIVRKVKHFLKCVTSKSDIKKVHHQFSSYYAMCISPLRVHISQYARVLCVVCVRIPHEVQNVSGSIKTCYMAQMVSLN